MKRGSLALRFARHLAVALVLASVSGRAGAQQRPAAEPRRGATPEVVARLPTPTVAPGDLPRPCVDDVRKLPKLEFASASAQARWKADPSLMGSLQYWAQAHFGVPLRRYECLDLPFLVRKFQEASGETPTGLLGDRDVDRLATAVAGGRQDTIARQEAAGARQQEAIDAYEAQARTGVALFGIELGAAISSLRLPDCGFDLSNNRPTCLIGRPVNGGQIDLYFSRQEQPEAVKDVNVKVRVAVVPRPDPTQQTGNGAATVTDRDLRVVGLSFRTSPAALKDFETKFGKATVSTKSWQNGFGAKWESQHYQWKPAANVVVGVNCGVEFAGPCYAFAELETPNAKQAPNPNARPL